MRSEIRTDSRLFRALSQTLLHRGYSIRFRARGRSMFPVISDGDIVEVTPQKGRTGDVVLLADDERLLAHRIVACADNHIVTRGDSCFENDQAASATVLGRISTVFTADGPRRPHTLRTRLRTLLSRLRRRQFFRYSG